MTTGNLATDAAVSGFTWTAAGAWGTFLALLAVIVRQVGPWRQISASTEQRLREDLLARVNKLEKVLDRERAIHAAERRLEGHKLANITQCFDALLMLIETNPERASDVVQRVREMRDNQVRAEALEKATLQAEIVKHAAFDGDDEAPVLDG